MSQYVETPTRAFANTAALVANRFVRLSAGVLAYAGITSRDFLGTLCVPVQTTDAYGTVRLRTSEGTRKVTAAGAFSAGANLYLAANGKVDDVGFVPVGIALEAATTDGDIVEMMSAAGVPDAVASIAAAGSSQSDAASLTCGINTVSAADGTKGVVLPTAVAGLRVSVYNEHASNGLKIYPATGGDINDGTANAAITIEGKTVAELVALDTTTWAAQFTVNT